jgi:hypothetical protein
MQYPIRAYPLVSAKMSGFDYYTRTDYINPAF